MCRNLVTRLMVASVAVIGCNTSNVSDLRTDHAKDVREIDKHTHPSVHGNEDPKAAFAKWVDASRVKSLDEYERRLHRLGLMSEDSIPLFVSQIAAHDVKVRRAAVLALRLVGAKNTATAIPALSQAAEDSDERVRATALKGLGDIGPPAANALPIILNAIQNDDQNSSIAALAIGELGVKTIPVLEALTNALTHHMSDTRASAALVLGRIGPEALSAVPTLREAQHDDNPYVRLNAAHALWKIDGAHDAIEAIVALLEADDPFLNHGAIEALGDIGPTATVAIPALERFRHLRTAQEARKVEDSHGDEFFANVNDVIGKYSMDEFNSVAAVWAIGRIRDTEELVAQLVKELENEHAMARVGAAWALGKIGPDAREAIPKLRRLCDDSNQYGYGLLYIERAIKEINSLNSVSERPHHPRQIDPPENTLDSDSQQARPPISSPSSD